MVEKEQHRRGGVVRHMVKHWPIKALVILLVLVGFVAGYFSNTYMTSHHKQQLMKKYNLMSYRIVSDNPNNVMLDFHSLQSQFQQYLDANNLNDKVGIDFEYLPTGSTVGIHENHEMIGASMLKLPLTIAFYKQVEKGKLSLNTTVALKKEWLNDGYGTLYKKGAGYKMTYQQLVDWALEQSDNTAALALFDAVSKAQGTSTPDILSFIDANYSTNQNQSIMIDSQSYASILKCLYYSCYLNTNDSQAVLKIMTHATDNTRLTLFTPNSLTVAHKIGTYLNQYQSDCGIFYVPLRNYVMCVMVEGQDPGASRIIGDLSLMAYNYLVPDNNSTSSPDSGDN